MARPALELRLRLLERNLPQHAFGEMKSEIERTVLAALERPPKRLAIARITRRALDPAQQELAVEPLRVACREK
jgi:hypothetical protein